MIRDARIEDIPQIVLLGEKFYTASHGNSDIPFDRKDVTTMLWDNIHADQGIMLVEEREGRIVGMICGVIFTWYFNSKYKSGQELFWYVKPEYRRTTVGVRLIKELEQRAKEKGCTTWIMISEYDMGNHDYMDNLYKRMGYRNYETGYIKDL